MGSIAEFYHLITNPEVIIASGGLALILLIIFAENGVFFGFFLPGDTLLFTTGLLSSTGKFDVPILTLLVTISLAAYLGSFFGYFFGEKAGSKLFTKDDSIFFKKKYMFAAEAFFIRYGAVALIMARFLPIIRTFAPIFSGIIKYPYGKFFLYNIIGGTLWVVSLVYGGYLLGQIFPQSKDYLEYIIIGIVIVTWIPVILTYIKERNKIKSKKDDQID
ncbi:VTT domain-containing protein [uncultured Cytophaga sp.]|uniref:DedA family protein n=1 Tax=uncultured Cytophaga sp. TaxID=160238 RepID=UPI0026295344|nr:VTT domain-containing protein [uncultured Cytophaga sp.]